MAGAGTGLVLSARAAVTGTCNIGTGVGALGAGNIVADPLFVPTARGDHRLSTAPNPPSPALDICLTGPDIDIDGKVRPVGGVDAGPFEM